MADQELKLYWNFGSQPSRAIKSFLVAAKIDHQQVDLDFFKGEHKAPEIIALNPLGTLPFITIGGKPVLESASILRYLACKYPDGNKFYPSNVDQRALIDSYLDFNGTTLRPMFVG